MIGVLAYNEEENIKDVVIKCQQYDDVIVVDDGSTDRTAQLVTDVYKHNVNKGYGATIKTLFDIAREKGVNKLITVDGDGQHPTNKISELIEKIDDGYDIVIGSRFLRKENVKKVPLYRRFGIKILTALTKIITNKEITDCQSGFRAYSKKAIDELDIERNDMGISIEILIKSKELKITEIPIEVNYEDNKSSENPIKHFFILLRSLGS